jgi:hypothetical protein
MDNQALVMAFQSSTILIVLVVLLLWLWPAARLDQFRQEMFEVRDGLFDFAASGKIRFDDPAYRLLRQLMNGFIRYGHNVTVFRVCVGGLMWRVLQEKPKLEWSEKWNAALKNVRDDSVQKSLAEFHDKVCSIVLWRLVSGSPALVALVVLGIVIALFHAGITSLKGILEKVMIETTSRVIDPRLLEEEAAKAAV